MVSYPHSLLLRFAAAIAEGEHPYKAALAVLGETETSQALRVHKLWANDPIVINEVSRINNTLEVDNEGLSKVEYLRTLLDMITTKDLKDGKDKIAALRLYAEVRGFLKKDEGVTVNNVTNKVLVVNSAGADDDWERKVQRQQLRLIQGAQVA